LLASCICFKLLRNLSSERMAGQKQQLHLLDLWGVWAAVQYLRSASAQLYLKQCHPHQSHSLHSGWFPSGIIHSHEPSNIAALWISNSDWCLKGMGEWSLDLPGKPHQVLPWPYFAP
jgi:hypothetical protein